MNTEQRQFDWIFYGQWVLAGTVALVVAGMLAFATIWSVGEVVERAWGETAAAFTAGGLFGALLGAGIGIGQALLLQRRGINAARWIGASVIAAAVGMAIAWTIVFIFLDADTMPEVVTGVMISIAAGLPVGVAQSVVLRPHVSNTSLWIVVSTLAFLIAFVAGLPLGGEGREWIALGTIGLLSATISGLGMVWLLRQQPAAAM